MKRNLFDELAEGLQALQENREHIVTLKRPPVVELAQTAQCPSRSLDQDGEKIPRHH